MIYDGYAFFKEKSHQKVDDWVVQSYNRQPIQIDTRKVVNMRANELYRFLKCL